MMFIYFTNDVELKPRVRDNKELKSLQSVKHVNLKTDYEDHNLFDFV